MGALTLPWHFRTVEELLSPLDEKAPRCAARSPSRAPRRSRY